MNAVLERLARPFRRGREERTATQLRTVAAELRTLSGASESDFLRVLERLRDFLDRARAISSGCGLLLEAFQGEQATRLESELHGTLARTGKDHGGEVELAALSGTAEAMRHLQKCAGDLHGAVRIFGVLGTATRIERERLGAAGGDFEGMSDQVTQLAADLDENSGHIFQACIDAQQVAAGALQTANRMERSRGAELPRILENAGSSLAAISAKRQDAAALSRSLVEEFDAVSRNIGELVNSLQYQDITRQRLEHVAEALEETLGPLRAGAPGAGLEAATVAKLQLAHLRDAAAEFVAAVGRIGGALDDMAARIREMSSRSEGIVHAASGDAQSLRVMEDSLAAASRALQGYSVSTGSLAAAAETVTSAIGPIAGFAARIEEIGLRIERVSLNTNVKAARLGKDGAALSAIAGAIQSTAADSRGRTGAVIDAIARVSQCAESLSTSASANRSRGGVTDLSQLAGEFASQAAAATGRLPEIAQLAATLAADVASLAAGLNASAEFHAVSGRCTSALEAVAAAAGATAIAANLEQLRARYTMETERAVHDSVLGPDQAPGQTPGQTPDQAPSLAQASPAAGEDLGDNVELF
jgi:methyl-accepting chemotaxis protein